MDASTLDHNPAALRYVEYLYQRYPGRVPIGVGVASGFKKVYPFVFEDANGRALGCVACAWNNGADRDEVQVYHVSAMRPGIGDGKKIMQELCAVADRYQVRLTLLPRPMWVSAESPLDERNLRSWYGQFGFIGGGYLNRDPKSIGSQ